MNKTNQKRDANILRVREGMPAAIKRLNWSREQVLEEQTRRLRETLAFAKAKSPFYTERLRDVTPESFDLSDLPSLEPVTKADVMENWDRMVTDPSLTLEKANKHLAVLRDGHETNYYFNDQYYICASGGSSGRRGLFVWDDDFFVTDAMVTHRMEARNDAALPPGPNRRTAVICAGSFLHASRMLFPVTADPERTMDAFSAATPIPELVEQLNSLQPDRLIGYSSLVEQLCVEALEGRLKIDLKRIMVNSEPLTDEARSNAQKAWGINIHNSWGSVEFGICGMESESFDGMILSEDVCIFEAVDDEGRIIETGPADNLIVTRFYGNTLPMIRYVMTDSPVIAPPNENNFPGYRLVTEIRGRADVWFQYGDVRIHPMVIRSVLGQIEGIIEYQVHQTTEGAKVDLITHEKLDVDSIAKRLRNNLAEAGLSGAEIAVQITDTLVRHPETNKLMRFVALKPSH